MPVSYGKASLAAQALYRVLTPDARAWLRGVGVVRHRKEGFAVSVRYSNRAHRPAKLPRRIRGVLITFRSQPTAKIQAKSQIG